MRRLLPLFSIILPGLVVASGCATDLPDEPSPYDSNLDTGISADARLSSIWYRNLPDTRPYQLEGIFGGDVRIGASYQGGGWSIAFHEGSEPSLENAQIISSSLENSSALQKLDLVWSTLNFSQTASAGATPDTDDIFTLLLTAEATSTTGESALDETDAIQIKLDNTPPIARITRLCLDAAATSCFGYSDNPSDFGATSDPDDVLEVHTSTTPRVYVHGIALDKNFAGYGLYMVGGQNSQQYLLCEAGLSENASCTGDLTATAQSYGFGVARDINYHETLAKSNMVDAYSDDTLLLVWDVSHLTPDAYALHLNVASRSYLDGDDDPASNSMWLTLLISP